MAFCWVELKRKEVPAHNTVSGVEEGPLLGIQMSEMNLFSSAYFLFVLSSCQPQQLYSDMGAVEVEISDSDQRFPGSLERWVKSLRH